jgi:hypothetical protein
MVGGVPVVTARQLVATVSRGPLMIERDLAAVAAGVLAAVRPAG